MNSLDKAGWLLMGIQTVGLLLTLIGVVEFGCFLMLVPLALGFLTLIIYCIEPKTVLRLIEWVDLS